MYMCTNQAYYGISIHVNISVCVSERTRLLQKRVGDIALIHLIQKPTLLSCAISRGGLKKTFEKKFFDRSKFFRRQEITFFQISIQDFGSSSKAIAVGRNADNKCSFNELIIYNLSS